MEPCYEYLGCDKKDCIMHGRKKTKLCWEVEGTSWVIQAKDFKKLKILKSGRPKVTYGKM